MRYQTRKRLKRELKTSQDAHQFIREVNENQHLKLIEMADYSHRLLKGLEQQNNETDAFRREAQQARKLQREYHDRALVAEKSIARLKTTGKHVASLLARSAQCGDGHGQVAPTKDTCNAAITSFHNAYADAPMQPGAPGWTDDETTRRD